MIGSLWLRCTLLLTSLAVAPVASAQTSTPMGAAPPASANSVAASARPLAYGSPPPLQGPVYGAPPWGYVQPPEATPGTDAEVIEYKDGDDVPHGYRLDYRARKGLVIAGGVTFGVSHVGTSALGIATGSPVLFVPVAGPFLQAAIIGLDDGEHTEANLDDIAITFLVADGVVQAVGAALLLAGFAYPKKVLVPNVLQANGIRVAPWRSGADGVGLVVVGEL